MARPKAFDQDQALQGAIDVFWAKGFAAATLQDLVEGMGINRQSLYDTFGDKEALYQKALQRYQAQQGSPFSEILEGPLPLRRALAEVFNRAVTHLTTPGASPCLLAQAALERAQVHPPTAKCVQHAFLGNLRHLEKRLQRAQAEGELGPQHDVLALARFLQNALNGLQVTARSGAPSADLSAIVRMTLSVLG